MNLSCSCSCKTETKRLGQQNYQGTWLAETVKLSLVQIDIKFPSWTVQSHSVWAFEAPRITARCAVALQASEPCSNPLAKASTASKQLPHNTGKASKASPQNPSKRQPQQKLLDLRELRRFWCQACNFLGKGPSDLHQNVVKGFCI